MLNELFGLDTHHGESADLESLPRRATLACQRERSLGCGESRRAAGIFHPFFFFFLLSGNLDIEHGRGV